MKIGIDFNGGDNSNEIAPAINEFIKTSKSEVYVFSTADNKNLEKLDQNEQIKIIECETAVKSSDDPAFVVRKKKNSTMVTGGEYLHQKKIDTFISAGNTGALVATGVFVVKRMLGVSKPALIGLIPSLKRKNPVMILDLGANINATEENLIEYAKLGTVYMREFYNINNPSVQLINIGEEPNKGIELYQNTYKQLTDNKEINFQGNIEPRNLLDTETDILVMDGWTGNILLKTLEGTLAFGKENLKKVFLKNIITKLGALTIKKDLSALKVQLDYKELGATPILGVDGLLLKCHGSSDEKAFNNALKKAEKFIEIELIQKMKKTYLLKYKGGEMLKITFPDGNIKEYENGITPLQIAKQISPSLAKKIIAAYINENLVDVTYQITIDSTIKLVTEQDSEAFEILNHSTAHLLAQAVKRLYPEAKFGVGPAIEEGFYYDIDVPTPISEKDLLKIEQEMKKIAKANELITNYYLSYDEVCQKFQEDEYKLYLIDKIKDRNEDYHIYEQGEFADLCRGVHLPSTGKIKNFKLLNIAGAYWLGNSDNKMLQRIYGTSWWTKEDLENQLQLLEERRERDHRKLGKELELFTFTKETGAGLPLWLPNGATIRYELEKFIKEEELRRGYNHVYTPVLGTKQLYETSGHWDHYQDDMFAPIEMGNETFVLRPMCCPHHTMIYKNSIKSYKDLPYRVAELGGMHRYEASGALTGLERVRNMCLNDGHIFVTPEQIKSEFKAVIELVDYAVKVLKLDINYYRLSLRDPANKEKYFADDEMWDKAERMLKEVLDEINIEYVTAEDEAAFYGPKLDIQIKTALGHDVTLSTIQLDFLLPEKFDLSYIGEDGEKHRPVMIHRGIISTMERMTATLIEQYKGAFPLWLAPTQINIIPVSLNAHLEYCKELEKELNNKDIRVSLDTREEKLNYKIREAQVHKIPYTLIIGDKEIANEEVTYRPYGTEENTTMSKREFIQKIITQKAERE